MLSQGNRHLAASAYMRLWPLMALLGFLVALALAWQFTPARELVDVNLLQRWLWSLRGTGWDLAAVLAIYLLGSLVLFPITIMITATGLVFGIWPGFPYALAGALVAATTIFYFGHALGQRTISRLPENVVKRVSRMLRRNGVLAVAALGMLPLAPFTISNLVAGASGVRLRDFLIGTLIGMGPGMLLLTAFGSRLQRVLRDPSIGDLAIAGGILLLWIAMAMVLQYVFGRRTES